MKELTKEEKGSLIFNYGHYLTKEKGFDVNDELIKQIGILEMCVKSEQPVPRQLLPLNELKEHLRNTENEFLDDGIVEMFLNEIDKYVIDFPKEAVEVIKSNMK